MRRQRHNSRPDLRAVVKAERLLSQYIARARTQRPQEPITRSRRAALPARELTHKEVTEHVARLVCLSRAICDLSLPVKLAGRMLHTVDLASFTDQIEQHVAAVYDLFDGYRAAHPETTEQLDRCDFDNARVIEFELAGAKKYLAKITKIGHGAQLDIGPEYLPLDGG